MIQKCKMSKRGNYKTLTLVQKYEILQRLRKGESAAKLSVEFEIPRTTVNEIKKNGNKIEDYMSKMEVYDVFKRKRMTTPIHAQLDEAMFIWFSQQRSLGSPLSRPVLIEKALQINSELKGDEDFKASQGWLDKFKARHGIRQLDIEGKKLNADNKSWFNKRSKRYTRQVKGFRIKNKLDVSRTEEKTGIHESTPVEGICSVFIKEEGIEEFKEESEYEDIDSELDSSVTESVVKKETALEESECTSSEMCAVYIKEEFIVKEESQCGETEDMSYSLTNEKGHLEAANCEQCVTNSDHSETSSSPSSGLLQKFGSVETKKKYQCCICSKSFTQSSSLSQHKLIHTGINKYQCAICSKTFTQSGHLSLHRSVHAGIKKHQCDVCNKIFSQTHSLKKHKLIHARIKKIAV